MAYILRSNLTVNNPDLQSYTKFGVCNQEVGVLLADLEENDDDLVENEFLSLDNFVTTLKDNFIWDKMIDVYPLVGSKYTSAGIKLKSITTNRIMSSVNGLSDSDFDFSSGRILGKSAAGYVGENSKRFETGVEVSDLIATGVGFHAYCGSASGTGAEQPVMGTLQSSDITGLSTQMAWSVGGGQPRHSLSRVPYRNSAGFSNANSVHGYLASPSGGVSIVEKIYENGSLSTNNGERQMNITGTDATIGLFGRNPYTATGAGSDAQYGGLVRFACISQGGLSDSEVSLLHGAINSFITDMGRNA